MRFVLLLLPAMLAAAEVRIGVLSLFHPREVRIQGSKLLVAGESIRLESPLTARADAGRVILQVGTRVLKVQSAWMEGAPLRIEIPGRIRRDYAGRLEVRAEAAELVVVVVLDLERAVATSVAAEMPHPAAEAAKAQAVLARSYYVAAPHRHKAFDFCDTTHCQLLQDPPGASTIAVARATAGELLRYEGQPLDAMYFRSCGGMTLRAKDVGLNGSRFPYPAVRCDGCARDPVRWQSRIPVADARGVLAGDRSENTRLELARRFGWNSVRSPGFEAVREGDMVLIRGEGEGHGVGVCQRGAAFLAREGRLYREILLHYLPGVRVDH